MHSTSCNICATASWSIQLLLKHHIKTYKPDTPSLTLHSRTNPLTPFYYPQFSVSTLTLFLKSVSLPTNHTNCTLWTPDYIKTAKTIKALNYFVTHLIDRWNMISLDGKSEITPMTLQYWDYRANNHTEVKEIKKLYLYFSCLRGALLKT